MNFLYFLLISSPILEAQFLQIYFYFLYSRICKINNMDIHCCRCNLYHYLLCIYALVWPIKSMSYITAVQQSSSNLPISTSVNTLYVLTLANFGESIHYMYLTLKFISKITFGVLTCVVKYACILSPSIFV
jgi:hypothetical protein